MLTHTAHAIDPLTPSYTSSPVKAIRTYFTVSGIYSDTISIPNIEIKPWIKFLIKSSWSTSPKPADVRCVPTKTTIEIKLNWIIELYRRWPEKWFGWLRIKCVCISIKVNESGSVCCVCVCMFQLDAKNELGYFIAFIQVWCPCVFIQVWCTWTRHIFTRTQRSRWKTCSVQTHQCCVIWNKGSIWKLMVFSPSVLLSQTKASFLFFFAASSCITLDIINFRCM